MKYFIYFILLIIPYNGFTQNKLIFNTCKIQYGHVLNHDYNNVVMDSEPTSISLKFVLTKNYFIEITDEGKYKYPYSSELPVNLIPTQNFNIIIVDEYLREYNIIYSYHNQTLSFYYVDGGNLVLTKFILDNVRSK